MAEAYREYSDEGCYLFEGGVVRPGDPVVVTRLYTDPSTRERFFDIAGRAATFDGYRPAFTADGEPMFGGTRVPHIDILIENEPGDPYLLTVRGFECDWALPEDYAAAIDVAVSKTQIPDYPPAA